MAKKIDPELNPGAEPATAPELNPEVIREAEARPQPQTPQEQSEWREEFPYPWGEDEIVTRRDTLRFLLGGSGALFLATGVLTILGSLPSGPGIQPVPPCKRLLSIDSRVLTIRSGVPVNELSKLLILPDRKYKNMPASLPTTVQQVSPEKRDGVVLPTQNLAVKKQG